MNDIGEGTIRRIDWTELTPVVLLLRVFNITLGFRILFLAMIGLWLTVVLEYLAGISLLTGLLVSGKELHLGRSAILIEGIGNTIHLVQQNPVLLLWLFAVVLVWTFCGGMICRIVAVRLTIDESEPAGSLFVFFRKHGISFVSSLVILLLGILCCFLPVILAGWLLTVPVLNYVVAALFPIPLFSAFLTVLLALGFAMGFMLLFAAVSTEGSDGFDAISRMFAYIYQRPLHYILYWIYCGILGWLGYLLVFFVFTSPVIQLCWWYLGDSDSIVEFWLDVFSSLPVAYVFAWFWTSSVAIYLLLRRSVDATPFSEVYRVSAPKVRVLPTIKPDEHGAPEIRN